MQVLKLASSCAASCAPTGACFAEAAESCAQRIQSEMQLQGDSSAAPDLELPTAKADAVQHSRCSRTGAEGAGVSTLLSLLIHLMAEVRTAALCVALRRVLIDHVHVARCSSCVLCVCH